MAERVINNCNPQQIPEVKRTFLIDTVISGIGYLWQKAMAENGNSVQKVLDNLQKSTEEGSSISLGKIFKEMLNEQYDPFGFMIIEQLEPYFGTNGCYFKSIDAYGITKEAIIQVLADKEKVQEERMGKFKDYVFSFFENFAERTAFIAQSPNYSIERKALELFRLVSFEKKGENVNVLTSFQVCFALLKPEEKKDLFANTDRDEPIYIDIYVNNLNQDGIKDLLRHSFTDKDILKAIKIYQEDFRAFTSAYLYGLLSKGMKRVLDKQELKVEEACDPSFKKRILELIKETT